MVALLALKNITKHNNVFHHSLELAQKGFYVLPLSPNSKIPLKGTNGCKDATRDEATIMQWIEAHPHSNIGIATGKEQGYFVLDIDVGDGKYGEDSLAELERTYGKLPDTVETKTQSGGRHLYFNYPQDAEIPCSAGKLGTNLDLRSDGGYCVAAPSTIDGKTYEWEGSSDPFDGVEIADAPQWLINLVKRDTRAVLVHSGQGYYESSEWDCMADSQQADFKDALTVIDADDRDTWVAVGMAIHSMDSGETGFNLWSGYSQKSLKFDAKDQARVWFSFKNKENKRNKETVFYMARELGWQSETKLQEIAQKEATGNAITDAINNPLKHDPNDYVDPFIKIDHTFPTDCNLLNQISGIINAASSCVTQAATTQATLALASLMASRKYLTPYGTPCHLYLGVCGESYGAIPEMREATMAVSEILDECGLINMVRDSRITSTQMLYKMLIQSPASLYLCDDYTSMIQKASKQNTPGGLDVVLNTLTSIYKQKSIKLDSHVDAGMRKDELDNFRNYDAQDDRPQIRSPALSMLVLMHTSHLPIFAKSNETARGSTQQFLLAVCDKDDFKLKEKEKLVLTEEVIENLYRVRGFTRKDGKLEKTLKDIFDELAGLIPHLTEVEFEDSIDEYDKMINSVITDERDQRTYLAGARENMRRLMTVLAAFNTKVSAISGKPIATKSIMRWCAQYVAGHLQRALDKLYPVLSDDGNVDDEQKVTLVILNAGSEGITRSRLTDKSRYFRTLSKEKRNELLDKLVDDGRIQINVPLKNFSGQEKNRIVHSAYLKKQTA